MNVATVNTPPLQPSASALNSSTSTMSGDSAALSSIVSDLRTILSHAVAGSELTQRVLNGEAVRMKTQAASNAWNAAHAVVRAAKSDEILFNLLPKIDAFAHTVAEADRERVSQARKEIAEIYSAVIGLAPSQAAEAASQFADPATFDFGLESIRKTGTLFTDTAAKVKMAGAWLGQDIQPY